jgi:hypothetical protein
LLRSIVTATLTICHAAPPYPTAPTQLIDAAMARSLHADACRTHALVAWFVLWDLPAYPERYAARLVTSGQAASPYLLLADTLAEIQEMLPHGLTRSERMPVDPPEVVEIWFAG